MADQTPPALSLTRRSLLFGAATAAAAASLPATSRAAAQAQRAADSPMPLRFDASGRFKIIQFNDTQDNHLTDHRTIEFMERVLDAEKPGFALINGDVIDGGPTTPE